MPSSAAVTVTLSFTLITFSTSSVAIVVSTSRAATQVSARRRQTRLMKRKRAYSVEIQQKLLWGCDCISNLDLVAIG